MASCPGTPMSTRAPYADIWQVAQRGDWEEARRIQDRICAGFEIVYVPQGRSGDASGIGAFKTAMQAIGIIDTNTMAFPVKAVQGDARTGSWRSCANRA